MMTVQCPSCSKMYNIPETMAGKQVRCKKCGMVFAIAADEAASAISPDVDMPHDAPADGQQSPGEQMPAAAGAGRAMRAAAGTGGKTIALLGAGAVGVVALAAVTYFVVIPMISGGQPGWTRPLMPEGTKMVAFIDVESFRESEIFAEIKKMIGETTGQADIDKVIQEGLASEGLATKLKFDDIQGIFVAGSVGGGPVPKIVMGIRLSRGMPLSDVISGKGVAKKKYKDFEYVTFGKGREQMNLAQIDETTLCAAPTEAALKKALDRVETGDAVDLGDELSSMLSSVSGQDTFFAMDPSAMAGMPGMGPMGGMPGMKGVGLGLSVNGSVDAVVVIAFKDSDQAKTMATQMDAGLSMAKTMAPDEFKPWLEDVDVDQSGSQVEITASIDTDDIIKQFGKLKGMIPMGGGPGGPPRGMSSPAPRPSIRPRPSRTSPTFPRPRQ